MSRKKSKNVVKYHKYRHINIGMVVFAVIFIYITVYMCIYLTRDKVTIYEVVTGKNAGITNKSYTALALREETCVTSTTSGYLNFFVKEGERVSLNSTVYTIDESGAINTLLSNASDNGDIVFDEENELEIRDVLTEYTLVQSDMDFGKLYDFKIDLDAKILECINLNNIKQLLESSEHSGMQFNVNKSSKTGIVSYYYDGFEAKTPESLTLADFDTDTYKKITRNSGDLVEAGAVVYKVSGSENWSVVFALSDEDLEKYKEQTVLTIKFLADNREMAGSFSVCYIEGKPYGKVDFIRYMGNYSDERFLDIQIVENQVEGLKIPKTAVVEKDFFIVPVSYATMGGDSTDLGFYKKVFDENGQESIEFVAPTIYKATNEYYYVDTGGVLKEGDFIVMPGSTETYMVSVKESMIGAYNVNNGYCVFRTVEILTETGDYYLVDMETAYGLKVFDHIVMDGSMVYEKQVVFSVN